MNYPGVATSPIDSEEIKPRIIKKTIDFILLTVIVFLAILTKDILILHAF